jgi:Domain of unknown function (DUF4878)
MGKGRLGVAVAAAALFAALAISACGSSNDNSADEDQITTAITQAATSGDPSACTKYQTVKFDEQTSSGQGQAAVRSCEKDAAQTAADNVDVTDVNVDGDTATATVKATGSIFDGQTLNIALVKEGDQWKLDQFKGFEDFNRDAIIAAFQKQLAQEAGSTPQAVQCVVQQFQNASDAQIESMFTSSNPQAENQLFAPCGKYFKNG